MPIHKSSIFENPFIRVTNTSYTKGVIMHPHTHDQTAISMILGGSNHETVDDTTCFGGRAQVLIKPAGVEHHNLFSDDCTILSMYLKEENQNKIVIESLLRDWNTINGTNSYHFLFSLMSATTKNQYYECLNSFLKYLSLQKDKTVDQTPPDWLVDAKKYIELNSTNVIRSKDLAKEFRVHPVYLARAFQKYFGQSIKSYLKILRINSSMDSIINEEDILAHVALKNGFADQSHLNRDFKSLTGVTPYEFKKMVV